MIAAQSLVWLALGGLFGLFCFGRWTLSVAAWLVPIFMLHFSRSVHPLAGAVEMWWVIWMAVALTNRGVMPVSRSTYLGITGLIGALSILPYLADRLLAPSLPGIASTLVFPFAWVTMELINSRANPFGTWGALAYTQYGNLPLMQSASVAGIWGIAFLVTWFASVFNWTWENNFNWSMVGTGMLMYTGVWSVVMLGGGARLMFAPSGVKTIRMEAIGWPDDIIQPSQAIRVLEPQLPTEERDELRTAFAETEDWFFDNAQREARAGAKVIVWPEASVMLLEDSEAAFIRRAKQLARQEQIYLLMGVACLRSGGSRRVENKAVFVNSSGDVAFMYTKNRLVPGLEAETTLAGDGRIPIADTPFGRIASAICFDLDFPDFIRQVGRAGTDVLLAPSSDWKAIGSLHMRIAVFRAVENGVSMVRPARWGFSSAVDPYGRTLATMNHFTAQQRVMLAQVPIAGVRTIYGRIGDLFAWLCVAGLLGAIACGMMRAA